MSWSFGKYWLTELHISILTHLIQDKKLYLLILPSNLSEVFKYWEAVTQGGDKCFKSLIFSRKLEFYDWHQKL